MGSPSWAVPTGVLLGLVACGLIFFAWFFPHYWKKGTESDRRDIEALPDGEREARRAGNRAIIDRHTKRLARERGENVEDDDDIEMQPHEEAPPPPYIASAPAEEQAVRV